MRVRYGTSLILYSKGKAGFDSKSRQIDFCLLVASETKNLPMSKIGGLKFFSICHLATKKLKKQKNVIIIIGLI